MLKMPLNEIIGKIKEKSGMEEHEINQKIDDKLTELSGLISKQGAAHIIANELGVNLYEQTTGRLQVKNLLAGMRGIDLAAKVQNKFEVKEFNTGSREGKVASFMVGDETGVVKVVLWNDQTDKFDTFNEGSVILIENAYVRENQGRKEVHINDRSGLTVDPKEVNIGEVKQFSPAVRKKITDLVDLDNDVEILGTVVQVFDLRFFEVCPKCGKRARMHQDSFTCEEHEKVDPDYSYVFNVIMDDGSLPNGTIRAVLFRNQAEKLLGKSKEEILTIREKPESFEQLKNDLLGNIVKMVGRTKRNDMFDRIEFVTQLVFANPDPNDELKNLEPVKVT